VSWSAIGPLLVLVSMEAPLLAGLEASMDGAGRPEVSAAAPEPARNAGGAGLDEDTIRRSRKMDLLLDVELPVSVSFGRAQLLLKDVIKLTTGSIIELNRSISEPVDVIVNNCVIARGEVVVVEGNFGVRVHEVVSRQERLRTLK
jgi:flagellar motor switch protein FliN/FliY